MKLRLMQLLLFLPCCFIDGLFLFVVGIPLWVICGTKVNNHKGTMEWMMELKNKEDEQQ